MKNNFEEYCKEEDLLCLLEEWDADGNGDLTPKDLAKTSRVEVWWKCAKCGYRWQTQLASRAIGRTHCPECYRRRLSERRAAKLNK